MAVDEEPSDTEIASWTRKGEAIFIELMVQQVKKGNRSTTTFLSRAWNEIIEEFDKRTGKKYKKEQLKNKFNKLRVKFREFKKLRECPTRFSWNPVSMTITAPDDVWEDYLKDNPNARQFRKKGCPKFDELMIIYGDTTTKGANAGALTQGEDAGALTQGENAGALTQGANDIDDEAEADFENNSNTRARSRTPTSHHRREGKSSIAIVEACKAFAIVQQQRIVSSSASAHEDPYSISKCCEILATISDLSNEVYLKAGKMIQENRNWREFFICTPPTRRLFLLNSLE